MFCMFCLPSTAVHDLEMLAVNAVLWSRVVKLDYI